MLFHLAHQHRYAMFNATTHRHPPSVAEILVFATTERHRNTKYLLLVAGVWDELESDSNSSSYGRLKFKIKNMDDLRERAVFAQKRFGNCDILSENSTWSLGFAYLAEHSVAARFLKSSERKNLSSCVVAEVRVPATFLCCFSYCRTWINCSS